jgi:hypothetical protein
MNRKYDPGSRYNENSGNTVRTAPPLSAAYAANPFIPRQIQGAPNFWKIAAILDGANDERYTYTPTTQDLTFGGAGKNANFTIAFAHGLSFIPNVQGTYSYDFDEKRHPLPHIKFNANDAYFNGSALTTPDYVVQVDDVDEVNITVRVTVMNDNGATIFLANLTNALRFKFYCFQDGSV